LKSVDAALGIGFGEGPVWRASRGDLVVTSVSEGALFVVDVATGTAERWADTAGGPNGGVLMEDDGILVAQNGGLDVSRFWPRPVPPVRPTTPGLQVVEADGAVRPVDTDQPLFSPNDLAVDDDGSVVFTDVLHDSEWSHLTGRLWRLSPDGTIALLESLPHYLNGVSASPRGLVTAERRGLRWLRHGDRSWLAEDCGRVDGLAMDRDGQAYVCVPGEGLLVVDNQGALLDRLELPDGHFTTNCCFGGSDLRTLFVTDAGHGSVLAFESMPTPGHPLTPFLPSWTRGDD
jgi:gluconolactonase